MWSEVGGCMSLCLIYTQEDWATKLHCLSKTNQGSWGNVLRVNMPQVVAYQDKRHFMSSHELLLQGQKPWQSWEEPVKVKTRPLSWKLHPLGSVEHLQRTHRSITEGAFHFFPFLFLPPHQPAMYTCSHVCGYSLGGAHVYTCIQMPDITPRCHSSEVILAFQDRIFHCLGTHEAN